MRFVAGWPSPTMVLLPTGKAVALLPTEARGEVRAAMFEQILRDYWFRLYGRPDIREHIRAYLREHGGDNQVA